MSIDKAVMLEPTDQEFMPEMPSGEEIEIEIVEEDEMAAPSELFQKPIAFDDNLAEHIGDDELLRISHDLMEYVESDKLARKDWVDIFVEGLDILGYKLEDRIEPWENACGVSSNLLSEALIRFQADTMGETFPAAGPVKTKMLGEQTRELEEAAERVREDMNYELLEKMIEYRPEHEKAIYSLGLSGSSFKKVYYDPSLGRQTSMFVSAEDVLVPFGSPHINIAERVTHMMRKTKLELQDLMARGFYKFEELSDPTPIRTDIDEKKAEIEGFEINDDNRYRLYEIHVNLLLSDFLEDETIAALDLGQEISLDKLKERREKADLEETPLDANEDNLAKPYVVTIEGDSGKVLGIRRNWRESDTELFLKKQYFVHYSYIHGQGFYGLGLIHIIGGYAKAGTSLIRQLVDAGELANLQGGFKTKGLRITGEDENIAPGEWKDVDVGSGSIKDNILPLPYKEPSATLLSLLDRITQDGRQLAATSDINISDMSANAPVGTTLALLERALKPMTAVQARIHYSMKIEFQLIKELILQHGSDEYNYKVKGGENVSRREDYERVDVVPVSDPNSATMAQRVVQYQAAMDMSDRAPQIYDLPQLHRQMLQVLEIPNVEKIVPVEEDMKPRDPISENIGALKGDPLKAFLYQDHQAHIRAHMAFMQDPSVMQIIGQSPQAKQIMPALQAHIAEHVGYKYRSDIEGTLGKGIALPAPNAEMGEEFEIQLSRVVADAADQMKNQNQELMRQRAAQAKAKDPVVQNEKQDLMLKDKEIQRKAAKDKMDKDSKDKALEFEKRKFELEHQLDRDEFESEDAREAVALELKEVDLKLKNKPSVGGNNG